MRLDAFDAVILLVKPETAVQLMRSRPLVLALFSALGLLAVAAHAHHGGAVEWQDRVEGPLTGIATEFAFTFPHVFVTLEVGEGDASQTWSLSTRWTPTILRKAGWSRASIQAGDRVTVTYRPHVSKPTVGYMETIEVNGQPLSLDLDP